MPVIQVYKTPIEFPLGHRLAICLGRWPQLVVGLPGVQQMPVELQPLSQKIGVNYGKLW